MGERREQLLDTAIEVLGERGIHALTHRAVDAAAGLPSGSTSNHFRTRVALFDAVVTRFAERERANWETVAATFRPTTPDELAEALIAFAHDATGPHRTLTLARHVILTESAINEPLRAQLGATGAWVGMWFTIWLQMAGVPKPARVGPIIMNHWTGLVLHQLAVPDPGFDPTEQITTLISGLVRPGVTEVPT